MTVARPWPNLVGAVSHLRERKDGSIELVADRRLYSRAMVKRAAATVIEGCHVRLDLDERGSVVATFTRPPGVGPDALRHAAGHFGDLLVAELVRSKLDAQATAARNLVVARALDGALPDAERSHDPSREPKPAPEPEAER